MRDPRGSSQEYLRLLQIPINSKCKVGAAIESVVCSRHWTCHFQQFSLAPVTEVWEIIEYYQNKINSHTYYVPGIILIVL